jgi:hypothetical protein
VAICLTCGEELNTVPVKSRSLSALCFRDHARFCGELIVDEVVYSFLGLGIGRMDWFHQHQHHHDAEVISVFRR